MNSAGPIRGLAIETSARIGSVALVENGIVLREQSFEHGLQHAARIVSAIDSLCRELGWTSTDLREIYVSAGPGSFTGLRIGITLAKTLAFATGARVVAVPTVEVIAENAPAEAKNLIVVLDAKREQIFTASFARSSAQGKPPPLSSPGVPGEEERGWTTIEPAHLDSLSQMLARSARPVYLIGEGIPYHRKLIPATDDVLITDESTWRPQAKIVTALGWEMARKDQWTDPLALIPIYIRRPEAEEKMFPNAGDGLATRSS